jgi:WD40 repeat protein
VYTFEESDETSLIALGPGNRFAALSTIDHKSVVIWDLKQLAPVSKMPLPLQTTSILCLSGDGRLLATVSNQRRSVQLWDTATAQVIWTGPSSIQGQVRRVALSPNGAWLAAWVDDRVILRNHRQGQESTILTAQAENPGAWLRRIPTSLFEGPADDAVEFSPDGKLLAVVVSWDRGASRETHSSTIQLWSLDAQRFVAERSQADESFIIVAMAFNATCDRLLATGCASAPLFGRCANWYELEETKNQPARTD